MPGEPRDTKALLHRSKCACPMQILQPSAPPPLPPFLPQELFAPPAFPALSGLVEHSLDSPQGKACSETSMEISNSTE